MPPGFPRCLPFYFRRRYLPAMFCLRCFHFMRAHVRARREASSAHDGALSPPAQGDATPPCPSRLIRLSHVCLFFRRHILLTRRVFRRDAARLVRPRHAPADAHHDVAILVCEYRWRHHAIPRHPRIFAAPRSSSSHQRTRRHTRRRCRPFSLPRVFHAISRLPRLI